MSDLCFATATELLKLIRNRSVSVYEVVQAHVEQIEKLNPLVNAVVTFLPEEALAKAKKIDQLLAKGKPVGRLVGLPIAHKDSFATSGIKTTQGSPIFCHDIPDQDSLIIERLKKAGAITLGKTNLPEFGAGSQTYNEVFGETLNPYDLTKTCGGSSGGSAVALACGMQPIADGSDMGGSLRNPANYCNVVGLRPSPGRIPSWPSSTAWFPISVVGPMARTVADIALIMSAIAGPDHRSPISISESADIFQQPMQRDFSKSRIAWLGNLGQLPVEYNVMSVLESQRSIFEDLSGDVIDACPDFSGADQIFKTWRAWKFSLDLGSLLVDHRHQMKETVIWNIEQGQRLLGTDLAEAEIKRTELYHRIRNFMIQFEFMILPVSQLPPFEIQTRYPTQINAEPMGTYIDWMKSCYYITVTGLPAISIPCGFTEDGLPVGVQIVGRHQDDFGLLQFAYAFEQATRFGEIRPPIANRSF